MDKDRIQELVTRAIEMQLAEEVLRGEVDAGRLAAAVVRYISSDLVDAIGEVEWAIGTPLSAAERLWHSEEYAEERAVDESAHPDLVQVRESLEEGSGQDQLARRLLKLVRRVTKESCYGVTIWRQHAGEAWAVQSDWTGDCVGASLTEAVEKAFKEIEDEQSEVT